MRVRETTSILSALLVSAGPQLQFKAKQIAEAIHQLVKPGARVSPRHSPLVNEGTWGAGAVLRE